MTEVRFDDLQALAGLVSESFGDFGEPLRVTQQMIDSFAEVTGDRQWLHVDVERARREGPFGEPIAHGYLLLSLLTALTSGSSVAIVGYASAINYGLDGVRFVSPVRAGSAIHRRQRMTHVRKKGPRGTQVTFDHEIYVVGGERPALVCRSIALFLG